MITIGPQVLLIAIPVGMVLGALIGVALFWAGVGMFWVFDKLRSR